MKNIPIVAAFCLALISCNMNTDQDPKLEKVLFEELTPTDFRQRIAEMPVAYLPLGTIEWHGEHLPLGADGLQSKEFFELVAGELGGIVYPMLFLGPDRKEVIDGEEYYGMDLCYDQEGAQAYPTQQFDGSSYWIDTADFRILLEAVLKQVSRSGFKVLVAHGHGPSTVFVRDNSKEWEAKYGLKILNCWGHRDSEGMGIMVDHAAMNETSLVMALRPELVHMEYLSVDLEDWPAGVGGKDPRVHASREKGLEIIDIQKERMIETIREALK